ncbi:hypothetical protein, partial [Escherichia coli]
QECWHLIKKSSTDGITLFVAKDHSEKPLVKTKYEKIFHHTADPREARRSERDRMRKYDFELKHILMDSTREDVHRYMFEREMMERIFFERSHEREK